MHEKLKEGCKIAFCSNMINTVKHVIWAYRWDKYLNYERLFSQRQ